MKISIQEFKNRLVFGIEELIDTYFGSGSIADRLLNATIKIVINQNIDKYDNLIELFSDKDGKIDTDMIIKEYSKAFGGDKFILDLRDFVENDTIRKMLPNKALAIKINDIASIFDD